MSNKTPLMLILFSVIFLNLSLLIYSQVSPVKQHCDVDSSAYLEKAELLYKYGSFAPTPAFENLTYYTLGYPIFMALIYKIFGESINFIILFQLFLVLLSAFLLFLTARRIFNETVGIIAFSLTCMNLGFLVFAQFVLTEVFLAFFLIIFVERFSAYINDTTNVNAAYIAALALGLSIPIKPAALYFPILILPMLYFINKKNVDRSKIIINFSAAFLFPILVYMVHNKAVFNEFKISKLESQNIYFWFYPHVLAYVHGSTSEIERKKLQLIAGSDYSRIDVVKSMFWGDIRIYPIKLYLYVWLTNVLKTFLGLFTTNLKVLVEQNVRGGDVSFFKMNGTFLQKTLLYIHAGTSSTWIIFVGFAEVVWSLLRFIMCAISLMWLFYKKKFTLLCFFLMFIFYFSMITGHDGCARFRMMFEFILIILASMGIWLVIQIRHSADGVKKKLGVEWKI